MKTILSPVALSLAAVSALAIAVPAVAQTATGTYNQGYQTQNGYQQNGYQTNVNGQGNLSARIEQLRVRIQAGVQSGTITRAEAQPLRQQLRDLTQRERQYSLNGLTGTERSDLQNRLRTLRQQVRTADGGQGYGQNDGNDVYGQQSGRIDRDNDGFDDRDTDRDGRYDDDVRNGTAGTVYGNEDDDRYEQPAQRGGIGGIIDNVLGRGNTTGLRVGQRASSGLYGLPSQYRNQYRDTSSAYFRTDGRQIYQIDARSQTVVRVYAMR